MFYAIVFTFGLMVGSFLNAVIYRLHSGESIVKARSHCPKCGHELGWFELIPVISFLVQRGKCRACNKGISIQYPLVELATATLFTLSAWPGCGASSQHCYAGLWFFGSILIVIFVYDLRHTIIPDKIIYPAIFIAFFYQLFSIVDVELVTSYELRVTSYEDFGHSLLSAVAASAFFLSIFLISKGKWIGFGDVKLAFFMGLILGWPAIFVALFVAFLLGGIIGVGLIASGKKTMKSEVPFGPFLVAGTFVALFWGNGLVGWYLGLLVN